MPPFSSRSTQLLPMSKRAACCPNPSTSPILVSQRHQGRASKLTPPIHAKEPTPSRAKRQQAVRTPKPSFGVRTACLRFHQGPHNPLPCRKGQLAAPTLPPPPSLFRNDIKVEQASLLLPSHPPQSGSKLCALQNRHLECGRLASAFIKVRTTPSLRKGAACCPNPSTSPILVSQRHQGRASKLTPPIHAKEPNPSTPKRRQAVRTPKNPCSKTLHPRLARGSQAATRTP